MGDTIVIETPVATVLEVSGKQGPQGPIGPQGPSGEASGSIAWSNVTGKPSTFTPSAHTHISADVTDFASAVVAAAPPTTNASLLTSGTLADARLSAAVTTLLGKADTASQPGHTHAVSDVTGLQTALDGKQATGSYAAASHTHTPSEVGLSNVSNTAQVTSVTGTAPIVSSGGTTPAISIQNSPTLTGDVIINGASTGVSGSLKVGNTTGSFNRDVEIGGSGIVLRNVGGSGRTTIALGQGSTSNYTLTPPAASGTIALTSDIPSTFAASAITSGVLDNDRVNFAAPSAIGSTTASSVAATTLSASSTVSGTGFSNYLASPPAIGGTSAAAGSFTTLSASTSLTLGTSGILSGGTNIIEQRNTTSAQTFRIYNTVSGTADANFERCFIGWSSNTLRIGTEAGGTGSARNLELQTGGTTRITLDTVGTVLLQTSGALTFSGRTGITSPAAGAFRLLGTDGSTFNFLYLGVASASYPALKRSSAILQVRLGDDTGYTTIDANHRLQGTAPATSGATGTAGDIRYDADYIYVCTAANTWKRAAIATW